MGRWIQTEDRQPDTYGKYQVMRSVGHGQTRMDQYLWNGSSWVTRGNRISYAVQVWYDEKAEETPQNSPYL